MVKVEKFGTMNELECVIKFNQTYHREPDGVSFCPYRICPLGAHIDHQYGKINGLAINYGINIAYAAKHNGVVELSSLNFPKRAQFHRRKSSYRRPIVLCCGNYLIYGSIVQIKQYYFTRD